MITRKHIIFYGYVQGVGFRWRAKHTADLHGAVHKAWKGLRSESERKHPRAISVLRL